ncbi:MAG: zinc-binding dehydrogenase [Deltaproteobacteria bacterium]|nr:zinc-binding dehydrogenase [Deltaproteobacteria bacterium]
MLPKSMKAVRIFEYGDPSVLQYVDAPLPETGDNDVLIKVGATSVTGWDLKYRLGQIKAPPGRDPLPMPFQLGRDMAGEVAAVGPKVTRFRERDRVVGMVHPACGHCENCVRGYDNLCLDTRLPGHQAFGGYAEYVSRAETELLPAPEGISFDILGGFLWSYSTNWSIVQRRGNLHPGDAVLITGASGGMGTSAIDVCRFVGASHLIGTTGSSNKIERLQELGCDYVVNYKDEDALDRVKSMSGRGGVDLVMDFVGGDMVGFGLNCLRMGGTFTVVGGSNLAEAPVPYRIMIGMAANIHGIRASKREDQRTILRLLNEGKLNPVIDRVLPLKEAADAHQLLERREQIGKIVLTP